MAAKIGADVPLSELRAAKTPICTVSYVDTVRSAMEKVAKANVLSAPFISEAHVAGCVDVTDFVSFLVHGVYALAGVTPDQGAASVEALANHPLSHHDFANNSPLAQKFFGASITALPSVQNVGPTPSLAQNATLADVISAMAAGAARLPVVDATGAVVNIVSQSTITHYLASPEHQKKYPAVAAACAKTLAELGLSHKPVIAINPTERAIDAFAKMHEYHVSALALMEGSHVLGNLSAKDVREVLEDFSLLLLPVQEYVNIIRRKNLKAVAPSIVVHPNDTLGHTIAKLSVCGIHRLFVTDSPDANSSACGVVSLRDIVNLVNQL
jgi:CBS domain-containing protein